MVGKKIKTLHTFINLLLNYNQENLIKWGQMARKCPILSSYFKLHIEQFVFSNFQDL